MKNYFGIIILFFCFGLKAQTKTIEYPMDQKGETSNVYNYFKKLVVDLSLDSLELSKDDFYFRYITPRHILEIWKNNDLNLQGRIISFVEKQPDSMGLGDLNTSISKKYHLLESPVNKEKVHQVYKQIIEMKLEEIPSSTRLYENSKSNLMVLELSTKTDYKFKEFWFSEMETKQREADKKIMVLNQLINSIMNYEKLFNDLIDSLPHGCYNMANGFVKCVE